MKSLTFEEAADMAAQLKAYDAKRVLDYVAAFITLKEVAAKAQIELPTASAGLALIERVSKNIEGYSAEIEKMRLMYTDTPTMTL